MRAIARPLILALAATNAVAAESPTAIMTAEECAVWQRERSFAASVETHDTDAFIGHLHADAVFIGGSGEITRGASAIAESWKGIIAGEDIVLRWYPAAVTIAGDQNIALSRGPYWLEIAQAEGEPRRMTGQFISTWLKGDDGQWRVLYDGGGGNQPQPATTAEIAALKAGLAKNCGGESEAVNETFAHTLWISRDYARQQDRQGG